MATALLIIDVQNDFTEGGALGVEGGAAVAGGITDYLSARPGHYARVIASRDWHDPDNDNGGHFASATEPDYVSTWPIHCVAGSAGADYHSALDEQLIDEHVLKGQGKPAYSIFEGTTPDGQTVLDLIAAHDIDAVDIAGIATDYCVRASALDAVDAGLAVRVLQDLVAGVAPASSEAALAELRAAGVRIVDVEDAK